MQLEGDTLCDGTRLSSKGSQCMGMFGSEQMKEDRKFLKKWNWCTVLMDEAHLLKDRGSYRAKRLRDVAQKAKQRVMLTGTPLQNDLQVRVGGELR